MSYVDDVLDEMDYIRKMKKATLFYDQENDNFETIQCPQGETYISVNLCVTKDITKNKLSNNYLVRVIFSMETSYWKFLINKN